MNKTTKTIIRIAAALLCSHTFGRSCLAYDDEGFQIWTTAGASFVVSNQWKAKFEEEYRLGNDGGNLYYRHSDLGLTYTGLADWLDLGLNYRYVDEKDSNDQWRQENRPHLNIKVKGHVLGLELSNRSRFEYRDRETKKDVWRYRNKIKVSLPFELTGLKLQPYIADEMFITLDDDNLDRNRLYFGLPLELSQSFKTDIYYLWQSSRSDREWKDISVVGIRLKINF
jgi:hypothetical protein